MNNQLTSLQKAGGCFDQIDQCRNLMQTEDPQSEGDVALVNARCTNAVNSCIPFENILQTSGRSVYDIRQKDPSPFPSSAYIEYLNTPQVQQAIGAAVNYTESNIVAGSFYDSGDPLRGTQLEDLANLLGRGIRVAFLYGDADYICNWQGGEAVSLSLATMLPAYSIPFPNAGYADIVVNSSYIGGTVRQFGNLSFARIYDSGHLIPAYQPETAFTVFTRIIQGTALSTGESINLTDYRTAGPMSSAKSSKASSSSNPVCWIRNIANTCTSDQRTQILAGNGVVMNGVWYASASDYKPPSTSVVGGKPGAPAPNSTMGLSMSNGKPTTAPTGVYIATGTPKPTGGAVGVELSLGVMLAALGMTFWGVLR